MRHEDNLQKAAVQLFKFCLPEHIIWFHCPNGEKRSKRTAAKLKAMGVFAGVADLIIVMPGGRVGFIELKAPKGVLSQFQKVFGGKCHALDAPYVICRSLDEIKDALESWGIKLNGKI